MVRSKTQRILTALSFYWKNFIHLNTLLFWYEYDVLLFVLKLYLEILK